MSLWQVPAVVLTLLAWLSAPATSLDEVARREAIRRQRVAPAARVYTNQDLPVLLDVAEPPPPPPAAAAAATEATPAPEKPKVAEAPPAPPADAKHDEAWWRNRMTTARNALSSDQMFAEALQSRINGLTADFINRDDPAQKAQLSEQRQRALDELDRVNKKIDADRKDIQAVFDDAKKNDVPSGWIR